MPRRSKYGASFTYDGPIFEKDVRKTFRGNARVLVEAIAQDGANIVRTNLPRSSVAPHYADYVKGRTGSLRGKKWALTAVVSGTLHLISKNYKGYGAVLETSQTFQRRTASGGTVRITGFGKWVFRRAYNAVRRGSRTARADLTKGLN